MNQTCRIQIRLMISLIMGCLIEFLVWIRSFIIYNYVNCENVARDHHKFLLYLKYCCKVKIKYGDYTNVFAFLSWSAIKKTWTCSSFQDVKTQTLSTTGWLTVVSSLQSSIGYKHWWVFHHGFASSGYKSKFNYKLEHNYLKSTTCWGGWYM